MAGRGSGQGGLLNDLQTQVKRLEDDLRARSDEEPEFKSALEEEYAKAREAERIAATYGAWRDERVTQVAAAWVLGTVFVRFCEDNELIEHPWIAGPGERLAVAEARHEAFFREHPHLNDRDWLTASFEHLAACHPTTAGLFDRGHNPLWQITPSYEAATELLGFWRRLDANAELVHDFTDNELDTRFLGDLYQDLSEHARKTYALLQTPEFVEEFILDLTLEPAVEEFGLEPELKVHNALGRVEWHHVGLRTIDPACGSGHFLLGLFNRLLKKHRDAAGTGVAVDDWTLIRKALDSVHGCDKNPFAVSIARFRLLIAVLKEAGLRRLDHAQEFPINVAVGDSLLHGRAVTPPQAEIPGLGKSNEMFAYSTEDVREFVNRVDLLGKNTYHVVVGNPPYITVKDDQEKNNYRTSYKTCSGQYALSVPFVQRMFELAAREARGFVGQITANSFMKREFGKKLIEKFFAEKVKLTHVIDTSGAFIPGHGTPTVILVGRNTVKGWGTPIRSVLGVRGEPSQPNDASQGLVWRSIVEKVYRTENESEWVSSADIPREDYRGFPWSLSGGGADGLLKKMSGASSSRLKEMIRIIGRTAHTGNDEAYFAPLGTWSRLGVHSKGVVPLVEGTVVRDWGVSPETDVLFPYGPTLRADLNDPSMVRHLWMHRSHLRLRREPGGTHEEIGLTWYEWSRWHPERFSVPYGISYAEVVTHNQFVLDRGGKVFAQTAPAIKLSGNATEEDHLRLLGVLNSSASCFWLKQVCHDKGIRGEGGGFTSNDWERFYQFNSTKLEKYPLPAHVPIGLSRSIDNCAQRGAKFEPSAVSVDAVPTRARLLAASETHKSIRRQMIALQEELDWQVYGLYGLLNDRETASLVSPDFNDVPEINLGERAFEIILARKVAAVEADGEWFTRHRSTPITQIPSHWPAWYQEVVQARIDTIEKRRDIALIERPECKRRWSSEPWEKKEKEALRNWLLDKCEERSLWFHTREGLDNVPRAMTVSELADELATSPGGDDVIAVAELYAADHLGKRDVRLAEVLREVVADQHVPYLSALRYKDTGLRKRSEWEGVWDEQREEDRRNANLAEGEPEVRLDIAVPPKYTSADFRKPSYWKNRGKLDVPKERFISYVDAGPAAEPALALGWAGWDHKEQAEALMNLAVDRVKTDKWSSEQVVPVLAGVLELLPWLRQWHGEIDENWGNDNSPAHDIADWLDIQRERHQLAEDDLRAWRPASGRKGRASAS